MQAGDAQERGEIRHLAQPLDNLVMQHGNEADQRKTLARRDLLENIPERRFETERGRMPMQAQRPGLGGIGGGILAEK